MFIQFIHVEVQKIVMLTIELWLPVRYKSPDGSKFPKLFGMNHSSRGCFFVVAATPPRFRAFMMPKVPWRKYTEQCFKNSLIGRVMEGQPIRGI